MLSFFGDLVRALANTAGWDSFPSMFGREFFERLQASPFRSTGRYRRRRVQEAQIALAHLRR